MDFPLLVPDQLREHLRALRKTRGLTQAQLGELLGVRQARIAEIESNPGAVSVEQLMKLLSALRTSLVLRDDAVQPGGRLTKSTTPATAPATAVSRSRSGTASSAPAKIRQRGKPAAATLKPPGQARVAPSKKGSW